MKTEQAVPRELGYAFPPEFALHEATWLSWPHKEASWPGKIQSIYPAYAKFIAELLKGEKVRININDEAMRRDASGILLRHGVDPGSVEFFIHPTNDAWCRDHGPAFLVNPEAEHPKVIVDWAYNAWGNKYPPFDLDDAIPTLIGKHFDLPVFYPGIVMEGGSVEFNGMGSLLTSRSCLLNPNRNPQLNQGQIEQYLHNYYGVSQVLWVSDGIVGDDTDGHIDDTVRFVNGHTLLTVVETRRSDENYQILAKNLSELKRMRLANGAQPDICELPMPDPVIWEDQRLPASYANFYIANRSVVVPVFRCKKDEQALRIIQDCFPDREICPIDSTDLIWGLGSFHCLSQQEPKL
jgi:agmatine deiminase